jgi:uncharacterized protein YqeY
MISNNIQKMIGEAMKAHDTVRLSTLRMLSSAFNYEKIENQHDLTEEEELTVIRKQAKQRKDSIEAYKKVGSGERAESEEAELKILQEFLPPEMDDADLEKLVDEAIKEADLPLEALAKGGMGKVIGMVKSKAPAAEGGKIAELVKSKLS